MNTTNRFDGFLMSIKDHADTLALGTTLLALREVHFGGGEGGVDRRGGGGPVIGVVDAKFVGEKLGRIATNNDVRPVRADQADQLFP